MAVWCRAVLLVAPFVHDIACLRPGCARRWSMEGCATSLTVHIRCFGSGQAVTPGEAGTCCGAAATIWLHAAATCVQRCVFACRYKKTIICQEVAKAKNVCQVRSVHWAAKSVHAPLNSSFAWVCFGTMYAWVGSGCAGHARLPQIRKVLLLVPRCCGSQVCLLDLDYNLPVQVSAMKGWLCMCARAALCCRALHPWAPLHAAEWTLRSNCIACILFPRAWQATNQPASVGRHNVEPKSLSIQVNRTFPSP